MMQLFQNEKKLHFNDLFVQQILMHILNIFLPWYAEHQIYFLQQLLMQFRGCIGLI